MSPNTGAGQFAQDMRRPPARPIDMMHLAKQALGDPGLELEILRAFGEITTRHFAALEKADEVPDMLHHLHMLKGAAIGVGAWGLAEHAHVMARDLGAREPFDAELVEDIRMSVEDLKAFIAERIAVAEEER